MQLVAPGGVRAVIPSCFLSRCFLSRLDTDWGRLTCWGGVSPIVLLMSSHRIFILIIIIFIIIF